MSGIQMALLGAVGEPTPVIFLTDPIAVSFLSGGLAPAIVGYRVANDSYVYTGDGNTTLTYTQFEQWDSIPATVGNYEIYASLSSGSTPTGTLNTWLNLGTTRSWTLSASTGNYATCQLAIQIRDTATSTVRATTTLTLEADAT